MRVAPSRRRRPTMLIVGLVVAALLVPFSANAARPFPMTTIRILDISDWHAQLDPQDLGSGNIVGGAGALSAYFAQERAAQPNTLTVTAGDDFGASPPISGFFDEVPAILGQRLMGIDIGTFGNHNFDRGIDHLQDMIDLAGSTAPAVVGSPFTYVSANLTRRDANLSGVKDYQIFDFSGTKVAIIGITNPEAPSLVFPGSFGTIVPSDPVAAAMRAQKAARKEGASIFIVITHMGITERESGTGPLTDFASKLRGFHMIIGDHTDFQFEATINGALVIENRSKSLTYSRTDLVVEQRPGKSNHRVVSTTNTFITPRVADVTPDPAVETMLAPYRALLAPILSVVQGTANKEVPRADACGRADGRLCESLIGNVVTDSMLAHFPSADVAITNSGGIRADLTCPLADSPTDFCGPQADPTDIEVTRGQTYAVLPFGNFAVTIDMTGAELKAMLENGVSQMPGANGRFAQVAGLCFTYDIALAAGSRVTGAVVHNGTACTATPLDLTGAASYRVAMNDFMAFGGDSYPNFAARQVSDGTTLEEALASFIRDNEQITPTIQGRIVCADSNGAIAPNCPVPVP